MSKGIVLADLLSPDFKVTPEFAKELHDNLGKHQKKLNQFLETTGSYAQAFYKLGSKLENKNPGEYGVDAYYLPALCYLMSALHGNKDGYESVIRLCKKLVSEMHAEPYEKLLAATIDKVDELRQQEYRLPVDIKQNDLAQLIKNFYTQKHLHQSDRINFAYQIFIQIQSLSTKDNSAEANNYLETLKIKVQDFLMVALKCNTIEDIHKFMQEKLAINKVDSLFVPNIKPPAATKIPDRHEAKSKSQYLIRYASEVALAKTRNQILQLDNEAYEKDIELATILLSAIERDKYRVEIYNGNFYSRNHDNDYYSVDTKLNIAHNKRGMAAFVINLAGELQLFDHFLITDGIAHSSMNAQLPVFGAGQIEIVEGSLTKLCDSSGHYKPSVNNLIKVLNYFESKDVDISNVIVVLRGEEMELATFKKLADNLNKSNSSNVTIQSVLSATNVSALQSSFESFDPFGKSTEDFSHVSTESSNESSENSFNQSSDPFEAGFSSESDFSWDNFDAPQEESSKSKPSLGS